jgi:hypothetical protein
MTIPIPKSRPGLKKLYEGLSGEVKGFFFDIPALVKSNFSLDIILAYVFFRLEQGQHQALYCGARKLHKTESDLPRTPIDVQHMTRDTYCKMFENIFGFSIDDNTLNSIKKAEEIRDRLMHGKAVSEPDKRAAISRVLNYAERINVLIHNKHGCGFKPYDPDLRGFTGRLERLDKSTTRWILKGMGFSIR